MTSEPPPQAKQDPETLVLRGRPRPAIRFRRSIIVGGAGVASVAVACTAWLALQPPSFKAIAFERESADARAQQPPDALANAPGSYGDVPQLGPPLPGDLGRPILEHRRKLEADGPGGPLDPAEEARVAQAQRLLAEREEAIRSALIVELRTGRSTPKVQPETRREALDADPAPGAAPQTGQSSKVAFLRDIDAAPDLNPHPLSEPAAGFTLSAGSIIPASLITGLKSDVPGLVSAQVTQNVFDSATGGTLLIPQGARLIGQYDSMIAYGQKRALIAWRRLLFPDGSSVRIDNWPGSDARGYSGLEDKVDRHTFELAKGVILSSLLGLGTGLALKADGADLLDILLLSTQQSGAKAGEQLVAKSLDIQPTLTVRPGWPLAVIVHKDLRLKPWTPPQ